MSWVWHIAVDMLGKNLKEYLTSKWNINNDDDYDIIRVFFKWKIILNDDKIPSNEKLDPYCQLVWDCCRVLHPAGRVPVSVPGYGYDVDGYG
jgi:hypothetical protein